MCFIFGVVQMFSDPVPAVSGGLWTLHSMFLHGLSSAVIKHDSPWAQLTLRSSNKSLIHPSLWTWYMSTWEVSNLSEKCGDNTKTLYRCHQIREPVSGNDYFIVFYFIISGVPVRIKPWVINSHLNIYTNDAVVHVYEKKKIILKPYDYL